MGDTIAGRLGAVGASHHLGQLPHHGRHAAARAAMHGARTSDWGSLKTSDRSTSRVGRAARRQHRVEHCATTTSSGAPAPTTTSSGARAATTTSSGALVATTTSSGAPPATTTSCGARAPATTSSGALVATTTSCGAPSGGDNIVWSTGTLQNIVWGNDCAGRNCQQTVWGSQQNGIVMGTATRDDNIVWSTVARRQHRVEHCW